MKIFGKRVSLVLALVLAFSMVLNGIAFAADNSGNKVERIAGKDRYVTAAEIAKKQFGTADTVVIARGDNDFADGLAASVLAGAKNAPILLTVPDRLLDSVKQALQDLKVKNAYIVGSEVAVSGKVQKAIEDLGIEVKRVGGKNRFETALNIAKEANVNTDTAYIVNGTAFADAMVAGVAAFTGKGVILPVLENKVPDITNDAIKQLGIKKAVIVGSTAVVSAAVEKALKDAGVEVKRLGGSDRELTSVEFAKNQIGDVDGVTVVNGREGLADAVGAAVFGNPILYTYKDKIRNEVNDYVKNALSNNPNASVTIVGGETVVTNNVQNSLQQIVDEAQPKDFALTAVKALNKTSMELTFNEEVAEIQPSNVTVTEKGSEFPNVFVSKTDVKSADKKVVIASLANALKDNGEYTVAVKGIKSATGKTVKDSSVTFVYAKAEIAKVEFTSTYLLEKQNIRSIVKVTDTVGRDVTNEVELEITTSDSSVINTDGYAGSGKAGSKAFVNVTVKGTNLSTGNTAITVTKAEAAKYVGFFIGTDTAAPANTESFKNKKPEDIVTWVTEGDSNKQLYLYYVNQYNQGLDKVPAASAQITNVNPSVVVVDENGQVKPVSKGTGYVKVKYGNVETTIAIEVREKAVASTLVVDKNEVMAAVDALRSSVNVTVKDQYGQDFSDSNATFTAKSANESVAMPTYSTSDYTNFKVEIIAISEGTAKVDLIYKSGDKTLETAVQVKVVKAGPAVGHSFESDTKILDVNAGDKYSPEGAKQTATVKVYEIDANGIKLKEVKNDKVKVEPADAATKALVDGGNLSIKSNQVTVDNIDKTQEATFNVKVDTLQIGTVTFTVMDSTAKPSVVKFEANAVNAKIEDLIKAKVEELINVYDQYGNKLNDNKKTPTISDGGYIVTNIDHLVLDGSKERIDWAPIGKNGTADVVVTKVTFDGKELATNQHIKVLAKAANDQIEQGKAKLKIQDAEENTDYKFDANDILYIKADWAEKNAETAPNGNKYIELEVTKDGSSVDLSKVGNPYSYLGYDGKAWPNELKNNTDTNLWINVANKEILYYFAGFDKTSKKWVTVAYKIVNQLP